MKIPYSNENGMTLLELLLSMVILMIVITIFFQFFSQSTAFNVKNEEKLTAIILARDTVSEIKDLDDINRFINDQTVEKDNQCGNGIGNLIRKSQEDFQISICFEEGPENLDKVTVKVLHKTDPQAHSETYTYVKRDENDGS